MKFSSYVAMATLLCAASSVYAGETYKADGCYGAFYESQDVLQVADNHLVITGRGFGTGYVTEDRNSPAFGAAGPCDFYIEVIDGKPNGMSRCVRTDVGGDKLLIKGGITGCDNGSPLCGPWEMEGLTGKWVGATGGGKWWDVGSKDQHYIVCFDGEFTMKN